MQTTDNLDRPYNTPNNDFPYMTDAEVALYWEAEKKPQSERSDTEKRVVMLESVQPDLMSLDALMDALKDGRVLSDRLRWKLEELVELSDLEVA